MKRIAVLLTCFNRKEKTLACLRALYSCILQKDYELNVFLVDDGSTDGTANAVLQDYGQVNIIKGTGSLYWNRGMHLAWTTAISKGDYDYYLWLNDDTLLYENAIEELLICNYHYGNEAIVCGAICSEISGRFTYGGRKMNGEEIIPNNFIQTCQFINGNCVLINKQACSTVGLLDPIYPHSIGDYEYGLRAIKKGISIITTRCYVGECERNESLPKWCYVDVPLRERFKELYSPLGNSHPRYYFIFEYKYHGLFQALKHYCSIHLRALMPFLWK